MKSEHIADVSQFLAELSRETDRGLPIVGAALIDDLLRRTLQAFFLAGKHTDRLLDDGAAPLGAFSARIDLCRALGLIDDYEFREISIIRKIRNEFAHGRHGLSFEDSRLKGLCATLESDLPVGPGITHDSRSRVHNALTTMVLRLYYRPEWVERERRQDKEWVPKEMSRWRSVNSEKPPEGVPVMVFGKVKPRDDGSGAE